MKQFSALSISFLVTLFFYCEQSAAQSSMALFKDTTKRMGSSLAGALFDSDKYIYIWGNGTGRSSLNVSQVHKIDTSGNEIWTTANSSLLTEGYISSGYADSNFIYAFGIVPVQYLPSTFFFSKISKATGAVLLKKDNPDLNVYGIIDVRDKGTDSIRVVCYSYDDAQSNPNWPPIVSITINKLNGNSSAPLPYGLESLAPLFIDANDMAYYYTPTDSLIKYDVAQDTVVWRNQTYLAGAFFDLPPTVLQKENNKVYLFGDRYCRQIDDNTGNTTWNIRVPSNSLQEFWPSDIVFKNDSIYTTWLHPYSGSVTEYGHFSKINKNNGTVYLNGTISDNGGVNYDSSGFFRSYKIVIDSFNDIFLFGHYYNDLTGQQAVKKISPNGNLISEIKLSVDSLDVRENDIIIQTKLGYATGYLFNNKPCFLYSKYIYNSQQSSARICFTSLPDDLNSKTEKFFDNDAFQYPSTVIDIKRYLNNTYVLKKQGLNVYLEKFFSPDSLEWRRDLSSNCYFTPAAFSIDSSGMSCVIGHSLSCVLNTDQNTLTSKFPVNKIVYINPTGTIINDLEVTSIVGETQLPNLLGTENGFYLAYPGGVLKLDPVTGYSNVNSSLPGNFSSGLYNGQSNKIFLTINDTDSIYVFSSRLSSTTDAFYYAVNKQNLNTRQNFLSSSFPIGYLLHAVKSRQGGDIAYVSGVTGIGAFPTIIKLNYRTNTVIWKYSLTNVGEAFKIVEDDSGFVYALIRINDSSKIVKLDRQSGNVLWQYVKYEPDHSSRSIDMAVNSESKMVIAAGLNIVSNYYKSYFISLNNQTGALMDLRELKGDLAEPNFMQAVESIQDSVIIMGGNFNSVLLDGKNGYLLFKGTGTSTPACSYNYWLGSINNSWENPGNWSCGIVPGPGTNVIINGGIVLVNSNVTISTLSLGIGVSFTINPGFIFTILN